MTRDFLDTPLDPDAVRGLIDAARSAPTAGNAATPEFLVLDGDHVNTYWDVTLPLDERATFPWPGLLRAPVLIVPFVDPEAYVTRYAEPDKASTGLGAGTGEWPVPYWWVDGGMAAMTILLAVEEAGWGALFFGLFDHEEAVKERFGVPRSKRALGTIAIGHPGPGRSRSASAGRGRRPLDEITHRGRW